MIVGGVWLADVDVVQSSLGTSMLRICSRMSANLRTPRDGAGCGRSAFCLWSALKCIVR